jgi:hypothetical protein
MLKYSWKWTSFGLNHISLIFWWLEVARIWKVQATRCVLFFSKHWRADYRTTCHPPLEKKKMLRYVGCFRPVCLDFFCFFFNFFQLQLHFFSCFFSISSLNKIFCWLLIGKHNLFQFDFFFQSLWYFIGF